MSESAPRDERPRRSPRGSRGRRGAPPQGPSVAALIVAHDQARRIAATVRAALAIPGVDLVLVVDDGSTDATAAVAAAAGATVVSTPNRGAASARMTGLAAMAEPMVVFLDADDELLAAGVARAGS